MAIAYDAWANSTDAGAATEEWSHTTSGSDRALFVATTANGKAIDGVPTYNGVSMTALETSNGTIRAWGLAAPATGSNTVSLPFTTAGSNASVSVSYTGVDQTTPYEGVQTDGSATTTPSASVTSESGDVVAGFTGNVAISVGQSVGSDQTARESNVTGTNVATLFSDEAGASSVTHSYTRESTFLNQLMVAWNINAEGGGGGDVEVDAGTVAFTLTTYNPTVTHDRNVTATVAPFTLTTFPATVTHDQNVEADSVSLELTTYPATVTYDRNVEAEVASLVLTTYPATVTAATNVVADLVQFTLTTYPATVSLDVEVAAGVVAFEITTLNPTVTFDRNVEATVQQFTLTTYDATVDTGVEQLPFTGTLSASPALSGTATVTSALSGALSASESLSGDLTTTPE